MRIISIRKERILLVVYCAVVIWGMANSFAAESAPAFAMPVSRKVVLIDAGHDGSDAGEVSGKVLEKNINLAIAQKLQAYLEAGGATVLMTRIDDGGLASSKSGDMSRRKWTANASKADIFVSIHQNSFTSANVKGAQVFYFNTSDNSKKLAEYIQLQLKAFADPSNRLKSKSNDKYFVLKQTVMPAVIVECGFLSNYNEKMKLTSDAYQEKIAWAIYMGIVDYFNE